MKEFIPLMKHLPNNIDRMILMFGLDHIFDASFEGLVTLNPKLDTLELTEVGSNFLLGHEVELV